jgi:tRNA 2-selenouridine synthase
MGFMVNGVTILGAATVAQLAEFDEIIDARSPAEFAADHIPGATNLPVLNDEERARIGTLYKQVSAFEAKKLGAALVSRNIADHLESHFLDKPKGYRPLVYCWRGGNRSGSITHVLRKIGFAANQLEGGYKAYRSMVVEDLKSMPGQFQFRVICGPTGSGKSRLLGALDSAGAQVLDLEKLAAHRGSVLGVLPDHPQPTQKTFESTLWSRLHELSPYQPVYVESESKKIGSLQVPDGLIAVMRASPCVRLQLPREARIRLLVEEYQHFPRQPEALIEQLNQLTALRGRETIAGWRALIDDENWQGLVSALLDQHYDPAYRKSLAQNYAATEQDTSLALNDVGCGDFERAAKALLI